MKTSSNTSTINVSSNGHVAIVEIRRPPHNYFNVPMIAELADAYEALDETPDCRAIVLCSLGLAFCAGADFSDRNDRGAATGDHGNATINPIYREAIRMFSCRKPVVAAVHGSAIGGGLGLALSADFRVTCAEARFSANFNRLGVHPGFGLTVTLPRLVGIQRAAQLFYTGQRINGEEAVSIGLADVLVTRDQVLDKALELATEIAVSSPLAVQATRASLRTGLAEQIHDTMAHESAEQGRHFATEDFREGVKAMAERRPPVFHGR